MAKSLTATAGGPHVRASPLATFSGAMEERRTLYIYRLDPAAISRRTLPVCR